MRVEVTDPMSVTEVDPVSEVSTIMEVIQAEVMNFLAVVAIIRDSRTRVLWNVTPADSLVILLRIVLPNKIRLFVNCVVNQIIRLQVVINMR